MVIPPIGLHGVQLLRVAELVAKATRKGMPVVAMPFLKMSSLSCCYVTFLEGVGFQVLGFQM